jgi:hypothetical protein
VGMFDYLRCELPMPDGRKVSKDSFQTKSLWCGMDRFTITRQGRLIYHRCRYEPGADREIKQGIMVAQYNRVAMEDIDMDYHGDLAIHGTTADDKSLHYAVRFTRGTVEWIRDFDGLAEIHRIWLIERGQ